jgi:hypothetical protein
MGQDTYVKFGVSVKLCTVFKNRELLYRLAKHVDGHLLYCYVQVDYDEVIDVSDDYSYQSDSEDKGEPSEEVEKVQETSVEEETTETTNDEESEEDEDYDDRFSFKTLYRLSKTTTKEEFNKISRGKDITYIFIYPFVEGSARNISRRENPSIYDRCSESVDGVQESIKNGIDFFLNQGVDRKQLEVGYHMYDSF